MTPFNQFTSISIKPVDPHHNLAITFHAFVHLKYNGNNLTGTTGDLLNVRVKCLHWLLSENLVHRCRFPFKPLGT